jgi:hypothetical protein
LHGKILFADDPPKIGWHYGSLTPGRGHVDPAAVLTSRTEMFRRQSADCALPSNNGQRQAAYRAMRSCHFAHLIIVCGKGRRYPAVTKSRKHHEGEEAWEK